MVRRSGKDSGAPCAWDWRKPSWTACAGLTVHCYYESPWQQGSKFILVVPTSMRRDFAVKLAGKSTQSVLRDLLCGRLCRGLRRVERGWEGLAMSSELLATYSGLGVRDGEEYYKGEECLGENVCFRFRWWVDTDTRAHIQSSIHLAILIYCDLS